jgi:hypothetical protein
VSSQEVSDPNNPGDPPIYLRCDVPDVGGNLAEAMALQTIGNWLEEVGWVYVERGSYAKQQPVAVVSTSLTGFEIDLGTHVVKYGIGSPSAEIRGALNEHLGTPEQ